MKIRSPFPAFLLLFLTPTLALCQGPYWGMTASGGTNDIGTIYSITESGTFTTHYSMDRVVGSGPKSDMLLGTNGKYYGVTEFGGSSGNGILFEYDPVTSDYVVLVEFNGTNGSRPLRGLTRGRNGRYYGMTVAGGTGGSGTLFEYNPATNALLTRINFTGDSAGSNGGSPLSRLEPNTTASVLYGTTQTGGANARGTVFSYAIPASGGAGVMGGRAGPPPPDRSSAPDRGGVGAGGPSWPDESDLRRLVGNRRYPSLRQHRRRRDGGHRLVCANRSR